MSIFEYNKEEEEQKLRKAEYEAGVAEGELKKARETALSLAEMGLPVDKIAEAVKISRDKVEEWLKDTKKSSGSPVCNSSRALARLQTTGRAASP